MVRRIIQTGLMVAVHGACQSGAQQPSPDPERVQVSAGPESVTEPMSRASGEFRGLWYDGNAELSAYRVEMPRYGKVRKAEIVLVYVTEPMNRESWIKDDDAKAHQRVDVIKLNVSLRFLTGIYPYSVMTSVFSPIDAWPGHRFSPIKVSMTAQEWCGHVFQSIWPSDGMFRSRIASYFASEGEGTATTEVPANTLYEDALLIQLRELDGLFAQGKDWTGFLVPSLWRVRQAHQSAEAVKATIKRSQVQLAGNTVTRFTLDARGYQRIIDIETNKPRRVLSWKTSRGEKAQLIKTSRLPYWKLNRPGDERYRAELGLSEQLLSGW